MSYEDKKQPTMWNYFPGEDIAKLEKKWMKNHRAYCWEMEMNGIMTRHYDWYAPIHREIESW